LLFNEAVFNFHAQPARTNGSDKNSADSATTPTIAEAKMGALRIVANGKDEGARTAGITF